ncbi:PQ-loop domain containing protein [Hyaloscypha variabilis]
MAASFLSIVSYLFGWIYFLCWSFSFYPQTILNWRRKSTSGTTIDFTAINLLGFSAYFVSNASFLFSSQIRREYALRNHGLTPTVQINDLAFAGHAVVITTVTWSQYAFPGAWGFDKRTKGEHGARMTSWIKGIIVGSFVGVAITALIVSASHDKDPENGWAWIDVIYAVGYVKVIITLVKYMPQVIVNYRNQSTRGWSILQMQLDFVGGILSVGQLLIDSYLQGDWSGVTGNPVKLALGNFSMFFDIVFMVQHFYLYRKDRKSYGDLENDPLLGDDARRDGRID